MKLIYHGSSTKELENEYVQYLPKVNNSTNEMYINSLLKKVLISNDQDSNKVKQNFNQEELEIWIVKRLQNVYITEYTSAVKKAKKWLDEWAEYYKKNYFDETNDVPTPEEKAAFYKIFSGRKINWKEYEISEKENLKKVTLKTANFSGNDQKRNKAIGDIGEKVFYDQLVNKYGFERVDWVSRDIDPFSPYDFKVTIDGVAQYYEVKSTTKNSITFFLSRNEYEFWKVNKKNYHLITIQNIYMKEPSSFPIITEVKNPIFLIDLEYYGTKNGVIYITPNKFKGWI